MRELYNWHDVAKRTEIVYDRALKCPNQNLLERVSRYLYCGVWAGKLFFLVMIVDFLFWRLLELWQAASAPEIRGMKHVDCHLDCSEPSSPLTHTASSSFSLGRRCTAALFRHPPFSWGTNALEKC
ncbi:hypothetical protein Ahy_A07g033756 isoform E [Arachis hypogaea]|nr:hypothetical protein Ahy_A07g033756 isoform E [Arachis hypogaea]